MAQKINAGDDVKRGDLFYVDPFQIDVKEDLRGRRFPPTPESVLKMAMSIYDNEQEQPVKCRKIENNRLQSAAGFTRINAIRLIRDGFEGTDGVFRHDPAYKVQVKVSNSTDKEALISNIVENEHRNATSDVDAAFNQEKLRERYGYNDTDIAKLYQYKSPNKVGYLRKLLQLTEQELYLVHRGVLGTQAGIDLLSLPQDKRDKIVADAEAGNAISGSEIADQVRDHHLRDDDGDDDGESNDTQSDVALRPRTIRNLRKFFTEFQDTWADPALTRFSRDMLRFVGGKSSDQAMSNAIFRLLRAKETAFESDKAA